MASFEIVEFVDGKPRPFPAGVFPDGTSAASIIGSLQLKYPNKKFQPRPIKDETRNWRVREQSRFDEGLYEPLGLDLAPIDGHYAHKALNKPENVAFTPNIQYGQADKQSSVHIKSYLNQFYPRLSTSDRRALIWKYTGKEVREGLFITQDADKIEYVYTHGPRSCMASEASEYQSPFHPTRVYAGPDLGIAYYEDDDEHIVARGVVWPDKKVWYNIYGDYDLLSTALRAEGYREGRYNVDWIGARLSSVESRGDFVCPYIDFADYVKWDGTYLVVTDYCIAARGCASTSGYTEGYIEEEEDNYEYDDDY